jgi:selenocysteine-specific translation elongation factor
MPLSRSVSSFPRLSSQGKQTRQYPQYSLISRGLLSIMGLRCRFQKHQIFQGGAPVIKVNQEKLQEEIKKLKQKATEKKSKAASKSDPEARSARKKVKRAQRKLRSAKAYKSSGKKAAEATPAASA